MYSVIGPEPKFQAQLLYQAAVIMDVAGVDWTMPSGIGWDNSDMAMFTGDNELMGRIKRTHYETASQLKVKRIVMGECGHAYRGAVYDGPRWLGWQFPPIPMVHAIEFYHDLIKEGRIKIAKKYKPPITLHDPCNYVRLMGVVQRVGDLESQLFLNLQAPREHVGNARQLRQADHLAVRHIGHMRLAHERQHMVLAQGVQLDILDDDHFVIVGVKHGLVYDFIERLPVPLGQELEGIRCALRCFQQSIAGNIFPCTGDDLLIQLCSVH